MKKSLVLLGLLLLNVAIQAAGAWLTFPSIPEWYAALNKPAFNPPSWIFGPVWTFLYIIMAIAAWLIYRQRDWPAAKAPLVFYLGHLVLNLAWSFLFFRLHLIGWALVDILLLWAAIGFMVIWYYRLYRPAGLMMVPYWLWVSFAALLNFELLRLNS